MLIIKILNVLLKGEEIAMGEVLHFDPDMWTKRRVKAYRALAAAANSAFEANARARAMVRRNRLAPKGDVPSEEFFVVDGHAKLRGVHTIIMETCGSTDRVRLMMGFFVRMKILIPYSGSSHDSCMFTFHASKKEMAAYLEALQRGSIIFPEKE